MHKRLFDHLSEHNLLYQSVKNAIMQLIDQINDKFENNCFTLGIFIETI